MKIAVILCVLFLLLLFFGCTIPNDTKYANATIEIRKDSASPVYILQNDVVAYSRDTNYSGGMAGSEQGFFPLSASRTFDYRVADGNGSVAKIKIIGYVSYTCS